MNQAPHSRGQCPEYDSLEASLAALLSEVPYPEFFHPELAPAQLDLQLALRGYSGPSMARPFRYCDIGCGSASTLIGLASVYPECQFLGIDIDRRAIDSAKRRVDQCGLSNVDLLCSNIDKLGWSEFAPFDYVVAHGLVSWVNAETVECLLQFASGSLKPGGRFFVSYNKLPEAETVRTIRAQVETLARKGEANSWQHCLRSAIRTWDDEQGGKFRSCAHLRALRDTLASPPEEGWAHDFLSPVWQPFAPRDFEFRLINHGLVATEAACANEKADARWELCRRDVFTKSIAGGPDRQPADSLSLLGDTELTMAGHSGMSEHLMWAEGKRLGLDESVLTDVCESASAGRWSTRGYSSRAGSHRSCPETLLWAVQALTESRMLEPVAALADGGSAPVAPPVQIPLAFNRMQLAGSWLQQGAMLMSPVTCNAVSLTPFEARVLHSLQYDYPETVCLELMEHPAAAASPPHIQGSDEQREYVSVCLVEFCESRLPALARLGICTDSSG